VRVTSETDVAVPLQRAWAALLDVPRVAGALPGATIAAETVDGAHRAATSRYAGSVRLQDVNEDEHAATFYAQGHAADGPGMAAATIGARLSVGDGVTHVVLDAEVWVSGGAVGPDAVAAALAALAAGLEREATALVAAPAPREATAPGETPAPNEAFAPSAAPAPLQLGGAALQPVLERAALLAAGLALGFAVGRAVRRR